MLNPETEVCSSKQFAFLCSSRDLVPRPREMKHLQMSLIASGKAMKRIQRKMWWRTQRVERDWRWDLQHKWLQTKKKDCADARDVTAKKKFCRFRKSQRCVATASCRLRFFFLLFFPSMSITGVSRTDEMIVWPSWFSYLSKWKPSKTEASWLPSGGGMFF